MSFLHVRELTLDQLHVTPDSRCQPQTSYASESDQLLSTQDGIPKDIPTELHSDDFIRSERLSRGLSALKDERDMILRESEALADQMIQSVRA